ncbi:MAG TPA: plastocyanin/azurin family copper-binding protein [Planctomycetota bacterium]|nr:plastocyanin/azurin family copper-binding protein [Planctomycetota bacterium]
MKTLLVILGSIAILGAGAAWNAGRPAYDYVVQIDKNFHSDDLAVQVGDRVSWKNMDLESHNVSGTLRPAIPQDQSEFDSGVILSGGSFEFTFMKEGEYRYSCKLHPEATGIVRVRR